MNRIQLDKYIFDTSDYEIIKEINRGGFGVVNLVRHKKTGEEFATKTNLINPGISIKRNKQLISREVGILIQVQHPTIIGFRGYSSKDFQGYDNLTILMRYMKGGSLSSLLELQSRGLTPTQYDNTKRQKLLVGISRGMMLLHERHIIHRDLKAENILLDEDYRPCITDFGLSKFFDPQHSLSQSMSDVGTAAYMSPEVINSDHFNTKADVYAFGILMNEILSGKRAYSKLTSGKKGLTGFQLKVKVCEGLRPEIEYNVKKSHHRMIEKCWSSNPTDRPSFKEIYEKLSLSEDDIIFEFENGRNENKLDDSDEEEERKDDPSKVSETDYKDVFSNQKYSLDEVDIGELFDYVDEINVPVKSIISTSTTINDNEIDELKAQLNEMKTREEQKNKEIAELKSQLEDMKTKDQEQDKKQKELQKKIKKYGKKIDEWTQDKDIDELKEQIREMMTQEQSKNKEVDELKEQIKEMKAQKQAKDKEVENMIEQIESMKNTIKEQSRENESLKIEVSALKKDIEQNSTKKHEDYISSIEKTIEEHSKDISFLKQETRAFFTVEPSIETPGILFQLKTREKNQYDRLFIASQSSRDIYNLIDPNTTNILSTSSGDFYVEFELEEPLKLNGIQVYTSLSSFPKSFDISVEGRVVKSIKEANELNGKNRCMTIDFEPVEGRKVRFTQTGPNWANGNFLNLKRFELLSPDPKYSRGVFTTLLEECENKDPHRCHVIISASNFDLNSFQSLNASKNIATGGKENSWFQVELTRGVAILTGFRLRKFKKNKLKSYKIISTDDITKPVSNWTTLFEINEKTEDDHPDLDVYRFARPSPPSRFIRLIQTDKNWGDSLFLKFIHFDLFGSLSLDKTIEENIKSISSINMRMGRFISVDSNLDSPGILCQLKSKEKNHFDRQFVASQSTRDIYNLFDPNTKDFYSTGSTGNFFIELELEEPLTLKGMQITSHTSSFPKSFDISVEGRVVKSIKEANELNGSNKTATVSFDPVEGRKVRFIQTGPNWDDGDNFLFIKRIDLLSTDSKYSGGVFSTLLKERADKDPHKIKVIASSSNFDLNNFQSVNSRYSICTKNIANSWFQVELTRGVAVLSGFRLKRCSPDKLKSYKIVCTDEVTKPESEWTTLIEISEKTEDEHQELDTYDFERPSPPTRFIRLIQTGGNWKNDNFLSFNHFDLFGSYF